MTRISTRAARNLIVLATAACAAVFAAAALAAPSRNLPTIFHKQISATRGHDGGVAILLPTAVTLDYGGKVYPFAYPSKHGYAFELGGAPNCGADACFLASFSATKGGHLAFADTVKLAHGVSGAFKPLSCGGSCSPPEIQWVQHGVVYSIQANLHSSTEATFVAAANSAITAGAR